VNIAGLALALVVLLAGAAGAETRFKVVMEGGACWLKDPDGRRFFSLGVDCAGGCYGHAEDAPMAAGRREWISGLLGKWGFNTAACWSSPSLWDGRYAMDQIYALNPDYLDVFDDAAWGAETEKTVRGELETFLGRPNVVGYFLDNERKWSPEKTFERYRKMGTGTPGSRALAGFAREFHGDNIGVLNRAWKSSFKGFEGVAGSGKCKPPGDFLAKWRNRVAGEYYRRYAALVRSLDPGCLILGERNAGPPDVEYVKAVAGAFDVISVNDYDRYGTLSGIYREYFSATGKPVIITEWSFSGFPESGLKSLQNIDVYSQENRAYGYRKYVLGAARAPWMVGMHWFLWNDYGPWKDWSRTAKGRRREYVPDNNMGLVSHDEREVYEILAAECARTNAEVSSVRAGAVMPAPPSEKKAVPVPLAMYVPKVDGMLADWPQALALKPEVSDSLHEGLTVNQVNYLSWDPAGVYVGMDTDDTRRDFPNADWAWEGDYVSVSFAFGRSGTGSAEREASFQVSPTGGGPDGKQPYVWSWGDRDCAGIKAVRRDRTGGFTMEIFAPASFLYGKPLSAGTMADVWLGYRNQSDIYETSWTGRLELRP
jgi:hypothetical protein